MPAPVYLLAGPASAGKTTAARELAGRFERSVHVPVDDLRHLVVGGLAVPAPGWGPELQAQIALARATATRMAAEYAEAGFTAVIDDFFDPLGMREYEALLARPGVRAVLLLPDAAEGRRRNAGRPGGPDPTADRAIEHAAGFLPPLVPGLLAAGWLVLDTTSLDPAATVDAILAAPWPLRRP
jgi:predicted kinase